MNFKRHKEELKLFFVNATFDEKTRGHTNDEPNKVEDRDNERDARYEHEPWPKGLSFLALEGSAHKGEQKETNGT